MGPRQKSLGNLVIIIGSILIFELTSMGPRQKSLGNAAGIDHQYAHWVHFNGAEAKKPRK